MLGAKACVWDATPNETSICKSEDLLKHIHHLKVNNEAEKGLSLTEVCRISMRTRDLLARQLQWLDSAMAELHVQAKTTGRVTKEEFVGVLRTFTGDVLDDDDLQNLFTRLDGENKGYVILHLTETERKKADELKSMKKATNKLINVQRAISGMEQPAQRQLHSSSAQPEHPSQIEKPTADCSPRPPAQSKEEQASNCEAHRDDLVSPSTARAIVDIALTSLKEPDVSMGEDQELRDLEQRLEDLRSAKAERMRRRRKRELQAEIDALQRELEARTPKAITPRTSSPSRRPVTVSFALPEASE
jgi:hypothetical protein